MRLNAEVGGERFSVEVRSEGGRVFAEVGGRSYELEARSVGAGESLLVHGGRVYEWRGDGRPGG